MAGQLNGQLPRRQHCMDRWAAGSASRARSGNQPVLRQHAPVARLVGGVALLPRMERNSTLGDDCPAPAGFARCCDAIPRRGRSGCRAHSVPRDVAHRSDASSLDPGSDVRSATHSQRMRQHQPGRRRRQPLAPPPDWFGCRLFSVSAAIAVASGTAKRRRRGAKQRLGAVFYLPDVIRSGIPTFPGGDGTRQLSNGCRGGRAGPMSASDRNRAGIVVVLLFIFMMINLAGSLALPPCVDRDRPSCRPGADALVLAGIHKLRLTQKTLQPCSSVDLQT